MESISVVQIKKYLLHILTFSFICNSFSEWVFMCNSFIITHSDKKQATIISHNKKKAAT